MQYKHTQFDDSVNVTHQHPLREFFKYCAAILIIIVALFYGSLLVVEWIVPYIGKQTEQRIWTLFFQDDFDSESAKRDKQIIAQEAYLQQLLNQIIAQQSLPETYRIILIEDHDVNALALPSGKIIVYTGLLDQLTSENAIVFVLGHELGHFAGKDHLRRLGRSLIAGLLMMPLMSADSQVADMLQPIQQVLDNNISRQQETAADAYALQVVTDFYGHTGGATEFFTAVKDEESWLHWMSTHPMSDDRTQTIRRLIAEKALPDGLTTPKRATPSGNINN